MWTLGQKAEKYSRPPSEFIPGLVDELTCYQFDNAILYFCATIEAAALERDNIGSEEKPKWRQRYTMTQLLDDDFRMPRAGDDNDGDIGTLGSAEGGYYDEVG